MTAIDPEVAFQQLILADPRMAALGAQIYSMSLPEDIVYPAICVWCFDDTPGQTFDGLDGLEEAGWRFDCYGMNYDDVKTLRRVVRDTMILSNDAVAGGGMLVTTPGGVVNIQSTMWKGGSAIQFTDRQQRVFGWEIEIKICVLADAQ